MPILSLLATSGPYRWRSLLIPILLTVDCGSNGGPASAPPPSAGGTLEVAIQTIGDDVDADGYAIVLDAGAGTPAPPNGEIEFTDLPTGSHTIDIMGVAPNCRLTSPTVPRDVIVLSGEVRRLDLVVLCLRPNPGRIFYTTGSGTVHSINALGGDRVTLPFRANSIAVNPVDGRLAYDAFPAGPTSGRDIWVAEPDGSNPVNLTNTLEPNETVPDWSHDGTRIAYKWQDVFMGPTSFYDILVMNDDGSGITNLTNTPDWTDGEPAWSIDDSRIVFRSHRTGMGDLYTIRPDGTDLTQLTTDGNFDTNARWSPDGTELVFARFVGGSFDWDLFRMNADGTGITQLTTDPRRSTEVDWSPDGRWMVFASGQPSGTGFDLFLMRSDGTDRVQLTFDERAGQPVWVR